MRILEETPMGAGNDGSLALGLQGAVPVTLAPICEGWWQGWLMGVGVGDVTSAAERLQCRLVLALQMV